MIILFLRVICLTSLLANLDFGAPAFARGRYLSPSETGRVLTRADPAVKRAIVRHLRSQYNAELEKQLPTFIVTAPVALENGHRAIVVLITRGDLCSPVGNCVLFVVVPKRGTYTVIETGNGVGQNTPIRVLPHFTHGYPDLTAWQHFSAFDQSEVRLRFNGKAYVEGERRNGWEDARRLPRKPEGRLLIGPEIGERLYP